MGLFNNISGANGAIPDRGFSIQSKLRVESAQFGDGYKQRWGFGINREDTSIPLSFTNRSKTEIDNIVAFLRSYDGYGAFSWTPPGDSSDIYVVCSDWDVEYITPDIRSLRVTFERVRDPTLRPVITIS